MADVTCATCKQTYQNDTYNTCPHCNPENIDVNTDTPTVPPPPPLPEPPVAQKKKTPATLNEGIGTWSFGGPIVTISNRLARERGLSHFPDVEPGGSDLGKDNFNFNSKKGTIAILAAMLGIVILVGVFSINLSNGAKHRADSDMHPYPLTVTEMATILENAKIIHYSPSVQGRAGQIEYAYVYDGQDDTMYSVTKRVIPSNLSVYTLTGQPWKSGDKEFCVQGFDGKPLSRFDVNRTSIMEHQDNYMDTAQPGKCPNNK